MSHYFSEEQESPLKLRKIGARLRGKKLEFFTASGVFSGKKVDKGTCLLVDSCIVGPASRMLDFGCGYGAVGIAIAKAFPAAEVVMTDINKRAVWLARMNIKLNMAGNASALYLDEFGQSEKDFDIVLLNPPQTAGKEACFRMIKGSVDYLGKGGSLQLVARHNKGGKELSKKMQELFGNLTELVKSGGYRVYFSKKADA